MHQISSESRHKEKRPAAHRRRAERSRLDRALLAVVPLLLCGVIAALASSRTGVVELGDTLWDDANGNGIQDAGEPGIPGAEEELFSGASCSGSSADAATTDANGNYLLEEPCPPKQLGGCVVCLRFELPAGYEEFTAADQGSNDELDSDVDRSGEVVVTVGITSDLTIDAGAVAVAIPVELTAFKVE